MSIVVTVRVGEGLVIAADSASTLQVTDPTGKYAGVGKIFNNATKVLQVRNYPVGVATWGAGNIEARSIASLIEEYANGLPETAADALNVRELVNSLREFLVQFYGAAIPDWKNRTPEGRPGFGVVVGGYSRNQFFSELYAFGVPEGDVTPLRQPKADSRPDFGANWWGATDALVRFHHGRDDAFAQILIQQGLGKESVDKAIALAVSQLQYQVPFDGMPLQDAIEYALFMTGLAVGRFRFVLGPEICGGPIDVVAITPKAGLVWVQRKPIARDRRKQREGANQWTEKS